MPFRACDGPVTCFTGTERAIETEGVEVEISIGAAAASAFVAVDPDVRQHSYSFSHFTMLTDLFPVADLVFWKDPRKSGIAFGTGLVILLSLACCSVISVVSYTALIILTGTLAFRIYKNILQAVQKTNEGHPFR